MALAAGRARRPSRVRRGGGGLRPARSLEETGLALSELRHGPFSNDVFEGRHYLTAFILAGCAEDAEARLMEPDKCDGWAWFDWADLPEPLFAPLASLRRRGYSPFDPKR